MDIYILPKHIWGKMSADERDEVQRPGRRGLRPVRAREVREGPVRPLQGEPELLGRQAGGRHGRAPQVQQPGRDGRRAQDRRARRGGGHPRQRVQPAQEGPEHRDDRGLSGRDVRDRDQRRRRPQEAAPGAARPEGPRGDRARDRQEDDRRPGAGRASASRARPQPVGRTRSGCPSSPTDKVFDFDLDEGEADPRRRRLQGHRRRRRARDAGRRAAAQLHATGPLRRRDRARRSPSSSPAGSRRSGSPRPRRSRATASSPTIIGKGDYDMFAWGWTPYVDPDTMLDYFTCNQVASRSRTTRPTTTTTRTTATPSTTSSTSSRRSSSTREAPRHRARDADALAALGRLPRHSTTIRRPSPTARTASTGWTQQPAKTGPVLFSNTSPTYAKLEAGRPPARAVTTTAAEAAASSRSSSAALLVLGGGRVRSAPEERRREGVTAGFISKKVAGVARHPGLRRLLQLLPVPGRGRRPGGEPVPGQAACPRRQRAELRQQFGLDGSQGEQFVNTSSRPPS